VQITMITRAEIVIAWPRFFPYFGCSTWNIRTNINVTEA